MTYRHIDILPGMRDVESDQFERLRGAMDELRTHLSEQGYTPIDTPLLEETELFVRKSGGELSGSLYTFTDPGGHSVSLRPEFTSSVIRSFIESRGARELPLRLQYSGPVFRYISSDRDRRRQFTQVGAEVIGDGGVDVDSEMIWLAWAGLKRLKLGEFRIRVGHLQVLHEILSSFGLSEAARLFIISNTQALGRGTVNVSGLMERARQVGILRGGIDQGIEATLEDMSREAAEDFIRGVLRESMPTPEGRRTTDQIVARLLRKLGESDEPSTFEEALSLVEGLSKLSGPPQKVLEEARSIPAVRDLDAGASDGLGSLLELLSKRGVPEADIVVDLGLARGISYYTGVIFELETVASPGGSLGGGGRYDGLIKALGCEDDVPALGFAYNLEQIVDSMAGRQAPSRKAVKNS